MHVREFLYLFGLLPADVSEILVLSYETGHHCTVTMTANVGAHLPLNITRSQETVLCGD